MTKQHNTARRAERAARLQWIPLGLMRVPQMAQRELRQGRVDHIVAHMDLEQIGTPTVNKRGGLYYVIDGQHRIAAYRAWVGDDWENQQIQCWAYEGLDEREEAERFLKLNDTLTVQAFDKFRVGLNAERTEGRAYGLKHQTKAPLNQCVAAAAVDLINRGKGGRKLPSWWQGESA